MCSPFFYARVGSSFRWAVSGHAASSCYRKFQQSLPFLLNLRDEHYRYYRHEKQCDRSLRNERSSVVAHRCWIEMMTIKRALPWLLALITVALCSPSLFAQKYQPLGPVDYTPSFQPFAPINDFLLDDFPKPNEGYFFSYERVNWSVHKPDRVEFGFENGGVIASLPVRTVVSLDLDQNNPVPQQEGGALDVPQFNTISSAVPGTEWGWGNRFELGYIVNEEGWLLSILSKVKQHYTGVYGTDLQRLRELSQGQGLDAVDGINFDDPLAAALGTPPQPPGESPIAGVAGILGIPAFEGYRSVSVVFRDPLGLLDGFIDMALPNADPPVVDGIPDDLNFNTIYGNAGQDTDGDGVPDTAAPTDFDDLTRLATVFDVVRVRDRVNINGVGLMKMKRLRPTHHHSILECYYGVRYVEFDNRFDVVAEGGVLADSFWNTRAKNRIVGPQVAFRYSNRRRRWVFGVEGRFLAGANFVSATQDGVLGSRIVPGAPNNPYFMGPTSFQNKLNTDKFSPVGELRVESSFYLSRCIALQVGWTGMAAGEIARPSNMVLYQVPTMGILNRDQDIFAQGVNFGIEINR